MRRPAARRCGFPPDCPRRRVPTASVPTSLDPAASDQVAPSIRSRLRPTGGHDLSASQPGSPKYNKIASAAVMACMPISPSRNLGFSARQRGRRPAAILKAAYAAMAPNSDSPTPPTRSAWNTSWPMPSTTRPWRSASITATTSRRCCRGRSRHLPDDPNEFHSNELGWQDPITVTVKYDLALLPGPGRLLARYVAGPAARRTRWPRASPITARITAIR